MATPATADFHNTNGETPQSRFQPTVCLAEWWLTKAEDDMQVTILAVAGNTGGGKQHRRVVSSLPILKRHDAFNLETTDGKYVIIKGLMNKARSEENGFPSHVCKHFVFGFPSFWKECTENYMVKETHSLTGHQPHIGSSDNYLESQDTTDAISIQKSMKTKSSAYKLLQKYETVISGAKRISNTVDFATLDMPVSSVSNTMKSLPTSDYVEKINILAVTAMNREDSIVHESGVRVPSTCHLYYSPQKVKFNGGKEMLSHTKTRARTRSASRLEIKQENSQAPVMPSGSEKIRSNSVSLPLLSDVSELVCGETELGGRNNLHVEDTRLNESNDKTNSSELDAGSPGQIPRTSNSENGLNSVKTRGVKQKAKYKAIPSARKPITADDSECNYRMDSAELDAGSSKQISEVSNPENGLKRIKTRGAKQKDKNKATPSTPSNSKKSLRRVKTTGLEQKAKKKATRSLSKPVTDRTSLSEDAEAWYLNAGRKLALETPKGKKEKVIIDSPQPSSFKRSRSGRLLMPKLEFWRNQIPIYNADHSVAGIEEEIQLEQPNHGTAWKKRRQLL